MTRNVIADVIIGLLRESVSGDVSVAELLDKLNRRGEHISADDLVRTLYTMEGYYHCFELQVTPGIAKQVDMSLTNIDKDCMSRL